jgi:hypothetical protein
MVQQWPDANHGVIPELRLTKSDWYTAHSKSHGALNYRPWSPALRVSRWTPFGAPERLSERWGKRRPSLLWRKVPDGLSVAPIVYKGAVGPGIRQLGPDSFA